MSDRELRDRARALAAEPRDEFALRLWWASESRRFGGELLPARVPGFLGVAPPHVLPWSAFFGWIAHRERGTRGISLFPAIFHDLQRLDDFWARHYLTRLSFLPVSLDAGLA